MQTKQNETKHTHTPNEYDVGDAVANVCSNII